MTTIESSLYHAECSVLVIVAGALGLVWLYRRLARGRDLAGVLPLALAALGLRAAIVMAVSQTGSLGATIRGPDDPAFANSAQLLADHPWTSGAWPSAIKGEGLTFVAGATTKLLGDPGADSLRLTQCVIAAFAVLLLIVAVHDLAGRGAAILTGAVLLLEPSSLFFTTILQKESLLLLAAALAAFAVARLWREPDDLRGAAGPAIGGLAVAVSVRPYAAGFLAAGLLLCGLHWAVAHAGRRRRTLTAVLVSVALVGSAGFVGSGAAASSLDQLQEFQRYETEGSSALRLRPVDFTTVGGMAQAVPERLVDLAVRPLPWQLANNEQRLGALGTVIAWGLGLWVLAGLALARRRAAAIPLLYLAVPIAVGYAVTSANAGTGFRHRLHLLFLLAAIGSVWWASTPAFQRAGARLARLWARRGMSGGTVRARGAAGAAAWVALRYMIVGLLNFGGSVYLIRKLGPEVWATYTVAFFIAAFFDQQVGTKVLGVIVRRRESPTRRQLGATALVSVVAGALILSLLLALRGPLAQSTHLPGLATCLAAAGGCALVLAIRAPAAALLERRLRFGWIAAAEVLDQVTFFACAIPLALSDRAIDGLAIGLLVRGIPGAVLLLALARPRPALPRRADLRVVTGFGVPVLGVAAFALIEGLMPFAVLGANDPRDLGWMNTAASMVGYAAVVMLVMQRVSFAALSDVRRRAGGLSASTQRLAESATLLLLIMVAPTALAEYWVPVLLGDSWNGAGATFAAVGIGYLLMGPVTVVAGALYASGKPSRVAICYLVMTVTYAALVFTGLMPQTAAGVAAAYALSRLSGLVTAVLIGDLAPHGRALRPTLAGAAVGASGLALIAWHVDGGPTYAALAGVLLASAAGVVLAVRQAGWLRQQARSVLRRGDVPPPDLGMPLSPSVHPPA